MKIVAALILSLFAVQSAAAQRLVMSTSEPVVSISSNFAGDTITIFGTIEPDVGGSTNQVTNNYNIVISIKGPAGTYVARKKTRQFGIWLNGEQEAFEGFPSYFSLVSSAPMEKKSPNLRYSASTVWRSTARRIFGPFAARKTPMFSRRN